MSLPTVFIIEDDVDTRDMLARFLELEGYRVELASNGRQALDLLRTGAPANVIVLDLKMPVMDGRTFYREMRRRGVSTPVVLLSAHGAKDAQRELDAEAAITKPFRPEELTEAIDELLSARP